MKKNAIILIVAVILVLVVGAFVMKGPKEEKNYELPLTLTGDVGLKKLSYKEYQEKIDNNESFTIVFPPSTNIPESLFAVLFTKIDDIIEPPFTFHIIAAPLLDAVLLINVQSDRYS